MEHKKLLGLLLLALAFGSSSAGAEQPAAENYRQIFASGNFYVEYSDKYTSRVIGEKGGKRMERTTYTAPEWTGYLNPLGAIFGGSTPKQPEVMYKEGKYYQFTKDDRAIVLGEGELADENLNPKESWNGIGRKLAVPMELAPFYWDDPYREKTASIEKPTATWSGKKTLDKKEYDCDRYASAIKSKAGGGETYYVYEMYYENGVLKYAKSLVKNGEEEHPVNTVKIKTLSGNMPDNLFKISKKTKVYSAGKGDMDDLLENPGQVGTMEGI